MITHFRSGRPAQTCRALILWCLVVSQGAYAWQQEYIADSTQSDTAARYTWDSDHQPRYEDILAERIDSRQRAFDAAHPAQSSAGLSIPVTRRITTGPVAGWRRDGSSTAMYDSDGDLLAPVSTLGWRVDSFFGPVRPWAQVSYNQPFGENVWQSQAGLHLVPTSSQYETWVDVSVGVDMPLTRHVAAWTSLSQSDGTTDSGDLFIYNLGLSAKF